MKLSLLARGAVAVLAHAAFPLALLFPASAHAEGEVNVYSYRQPQLIQPLFDRFTAETDIAVNVIFAAQGLEERMAAEGTNSPADVLLSVDVGRLDNAVKLGITQPLENETVNANIPEPFREASGHWFGVTSRARVIFAARDRVPENAITYEELVDPKWRGRICTRSGQHPYTLGLIAAMIAHHGPEKAEAWLTGLRDNLARKPTGNDRAQAQAIFSGLCDIALGNTYYMGLMETNDKEPEQQQWAASLKVLFPNTGDRGSHVNISGMALAAHAPNRDNAMRLMAFLSSGEAQAIYAETNYEYPVKPGVPPSARVAAWGNMHPDQLPLQTIADNRKAASEMVDRVAFDDGPAN